MFLLNESYLTSSFIDCSLCFFAVADFKIELQALRDKLAKMSQQARAPTLVPPPVVPAPTAIRSHTGLPVTAMSHEGSPTQALQIISAGSACASEPTASPVVLPGQELAPGPKAMQQEDNAPNAADKAVTAFADGSLTPGLTLMDPPQAPLVHPQAILGAPKACEPTLMRSTPTAPASALTASPSVSPAISLAPHSSSSSSTGSKRGFALSSSSAFGVMASAFGGGHSSSSAAEHAAPLAAAMSPGTASPAVALAAFGSPFAKTPSAIAAATTGSDLQASPGSAAASGPPAAAAPPHAPAPLANTPAAVRGGGGLVMPIVVAPPQSLTPDDAPVSGEPVFEKELPPTAVATTPVFTDIAGLAEAPAPFGSPVASPEPAAAVGNSGVALGVITATTCSSSGPATLGFTATTAAMPPAAVYGNESAEPAVPETTMPEEPSGSLHSLAPAGPGDSAMPVSSAGDAQARPSVCFFCKSRPVSGFHVQGWLGPLLCRTKVQNFR